MVTNTLTTLPSGWIDTRGSKTPYIQLAATPAKVASTLSEYHHSGRKAKYKTTASSSSLIHLRLPMLNSESLEPENEYGC